MNGIHYSFPDPTSNLLFDEVLLQCADKESGGEFVRLWESEVYFVVLGRTCKEEENLNMHNIVLDKVNVYRRSSGGGTVVQGRGCFNFSLILSKKVRPELNEITSSYQLIGEHMLSVLQSCGVNAHFKPICDLADAHSNKKFSGNAQKRGRNFILHHGTIMYDFDLSLVERYLTMPPKEPVYRKGRSHEDFVTNIDIDLQQFKEGLSQIFGVKEWRKNVVEEERIVLELLKQEKNMHVKLC